MFIEPKTSSEKPLCFPSMTANNKIKRCHHLEAHPLQVRNKQDWDRGFIFLLPQAAVLPGSDAGSDVV